MKFYKSYDYIVEKSKQTPPTMAYDGSSDLAQWQTTARAKLEELLGLPLQRCDDQFSILSTTQTETYLRTEFEFQSEQGYFQKGVFLYPLNCEGKRPLAICLQGHATGMHISLGEPRFPGDAAGIAGGRDMAIQAINRGYGAVAIDQRYMGATGQHPESGNPACLSYNHCMPSLLLGRTAIGERVWDVQRLIDVMFSHFADFVDQRKVICMGNSGGGTTTFYASCMDNRISIAVPSCAVCSYDASIIPLWHCPCNFIPDIRKYMEMGDVGCLLAPKHLILVCGVTDNIFPLAGTEEAYSKIQSAYRWLGKEDLCTIVRGNGGHQFYPEEAWPLIDQALSR